MAEIALKLHCVATYAKFRGYVDDPRNTDNAWMETTCVNFHDTTGLLDEVELQVLRFCRNSRAVSHGIALYITS